ncbi:MAG: ANTAR domain-containing protein [Streptosporangiales bacterium]
MRLRDQTVGGLSLFCNGGDPRPGAGQRPAQALSDVATIGILPQRSAHHSAMLAEQLQLALNSRVIIEQAKGILAERNGGHERRLRRTALARPRNIKLTDLARGDVAPSPSGPSRTTGRCRCRGGWPFTAGSCHPDTT